MSVFTNPGGGKPTHLVAQQNTGPDGGFAFRGLSPDSYSYGASKDGYRTANGDVQARPGKGDRAFTYWDYRAGMMHKNLGMRIDYVLASAPVSSAITDAYVDREARKGKGASDHAPIVVDADLA